MGKKMSQGITLKNLVSMTNGIVGLSILAMPYCFEQCGLILGSVTLLFCALMTSYSCRLLIKTIEMTKTNSFEFLALRLFGHKGKLLIEICIIILLYGSLVTNQQALCDTGPTFVSNLLSFKGYTIPRFAFMFVFTIFVSLPLSLSKKLEGLHNISACAVLFYFCFGLYLIWEASYKFIDYEWLDKINLWKFEGLLKCFPIFSISFSCQTVLFVVYDELEDKDKIIDLLDFGIVIAFTCYFLAGFFGYIAFFDTTLYGNITYNIPEGFMSQVLLFGFIICVISGFPFMVYPCRTSLNTLFYSNNKDEVLDSDLYIPEHRFKYLTYIIVFATTSTAILVPNLEFVLSLTGATAGSLTSYVWPSLLYKKSKSKQSNQRNKLVDIFLVIGILICFACSLASLLEYKPTQENNEVDNVLAKRLISDNTNVLTEPKIELEQNQNQNQIRLEPPLPNDLMANTIRKFTKFIQERTVPN